MSPITHHKQPKSSNLKMSQKITLFDVISFVKKREFKKLHDLIVTNERALFSPNFKTPLNILMLEKEDISEDGRLLLDFILNQINSKNQILSHIKENLFLRDSYLLSKLLDKLSFDEMKDNGIVHYASYFQGLGILNYLVNRFDLSRKTKNNLFNFNIPDVGTPLFLAICSEHTETINFIYNNGGRMDAKSSFGKILASTKSRETQYNLLSQFIGCHLNPANQSQWFSNEPKKTVYENFLQLCKTEKSFQKNNFIEFITSLKNKEDIFDKMDFSEKAETKNKKLLL